MKTPPKLDNPCQAIQQLSADLRDPDGGCPWDIKQNHLSVVENLIEETYEVADAVENLDPQDPDSYKALKEELGDLLFQVVFHSQMAKEKGAFTFDDVAKAAVEKLVKRHPHVYGDNAGKHDQNTAEEVLTNWESIKRKEKEEQNRHHESMLSGIPGALPALLKAYRIGHKVSRVNFDWQSSAIDELFKKVDEEFQEFLDELPESPDDFKEPGHNEALAAKKERAEEEMGDLLFVLAQLARHYHIDPEFALQKANRKFQTRFEKMEERFRQRLSQNDYPSIDEWENAWNAVKKDR